MMAVHLVIEGVIGLAIGLTAAVFLHGVAVAAEVLSLQMGLSLGASFSPLAEITVPGLGELKGFMVLALYTTLGGHLALVRALGASLRTLPLGGEVDVVAGAQGLVALAGTVFVVAIRAAAPLLVALFVTHLALAILNRAVPQLNTIMVSVPVTVGIGLLLLGAAVPITAQYVAEWVGGIESAAQTILVPFHLSPGR
jgi:flagellar biosynthetic protein FliR